MKRYYDTLFLSTIRFLIERAIHIFILCVYVLCIYIIYMHPLIPKISLILTLLLLLFPLLDEWWRSFEGCWRETIFEGLIKIPFSESYPSSSCELKALCVPAPYTCARDPPPWLEWADKEDSGRDFNTPGSLGYWSHGRNIRFAKIEEGIAI